jgi:phospholipid/cholesterol/gamma-HCH transport system substrate-binding protein
MRSTKNTRAVVVGIFIFLGVAIFILTVLTLGGQQKTFAKSVVIKAIFDDISGLQKGNNIWFSGVKIGTVKKISFYGNSQVEVDMNIEQSSSQYIRKNSLAKISSEGFIGNRIVVIFSPGGNSPVVETGDMIGVEKAVNTDEMMNTFQANNKNLLDITNDFKVISRGITEGKGTVGKLLTDETLVNELHTTMATLKRASSNAQRLSEDVSDYTARLNNKGTLANDLVTDTTIFSSLRTTVAKLQEVSRTANNIVENLNATSQSINTKLNSPNTPAGLLLNDKEAAENIRVTLRYLQSSSIKLDEDLEAAQHNFLLRGFFKKKAKKEAEEKTLVNP